MAYLANSFFWWSGAALITLMTLHTVLWLGATVQRYRHEQRRRRFSEQVFQAELAAARHRVAVLAERGVAWQGWRKFRVARKVPENEEGSICSFYLEPHDGKPAPTFEPGQYLTFQARVPGEPKPLVRCYSLSCAPHEPFYRVTIRRVPAPPGGEFPPGRMSGYFHDRVNVGDILDVKAPGGSFTLDVTASYPVVLLAGGVGITPLLSMLDAIVHAGGERECWLVYGARHGADQVMKQHLRRIRAEYPNVHIHLCYSDPREGEDVIGRDYDHAERVSVDLLQRLLPSSNYDFYICGPPPMMDSLKSDLDEWGVPTDCVHAEAFGPVHKKKPVKAEQPAGARTVEVKFVRTGKTCQWSPEAGTLLEFARANGIAVDSGCEQGDCGTCMLPIHLGDVEYMKTPGFKAEGGTCLACVCTPKSPLELDA